MADPHRVIRKIMKARVRDDNMPVSLGQGTRFNLMNVWGELGYRQVAEIGVKAGEFSREILTRNPHCTLFCIDVWDEYEFGIQTKQDQELYLQRARTALEAFAPRAVFMRLSSMNALHDFADGSLDAVYIDGDHTFDFCCPDIIYWSKKVRSGGMVAVHDYCAMRRSGVMKAVDAYTHCHNINPWYVTRETLPTAFWVKP